MVEDETRLTGSVSEFEDDWRYVLSSGDDRYYIFPSLMTGRQADLFEWIKAQQIEQLLAKAGIHSGNLLEYGCGAAGLSLYLSEKGYQTHLCDLSQNALKVAHKNQLCHIPDHPVSSATVANVLTLPYVDASFEVVMSYGLLEHFETDSLKQLLKESLRVLKPGGMLIADIVPGIGVFNARTVGVYMSFLASAGVQLLKGRWRNLSHLSRSYFHHYFETTFNDRQWIEILESCQLQDVKVAVCRPFPILALSGKPETAYTELIKQSLRFHRWFDGANNWFTRRWGWMYLATGVKARS